MGHLAHQCHSKGRGAPRESTNRSSTSQTVSAVVSGEAVILPSKRGGVAELRHQLQEAEVDAVMTEAATTMHGVYSPNTNNACSGLILTVDVEYKGTPMRALVDTVTSHYSFAKVPP